jgi:hypothetical protein
MRKFTVLLWDWISQSSDTQRSEYLKKLARGPIFTVVTYQGYDINGYTPYTKQQDKKNTYQNSCVRVDDYDVMGVRVNYLSTMRRRLWLLDIDMIDSF